MNMAPNYNSNDFNAVFSRLETLLEAQANSLEEIKNNTAKLQERVEKLEGWNVKQTGFVAGVAGVVSFLFAFFKSLLA